MKLGEKQAVAPLVARLDDQDKDIRLAVIGALGQLGDKPAVTPLLAKLDDQDTDVRRAVIGALGQLGDKQAVAPLLAKLDDPVKAVRRAVIGALGQLGDRQAVAPLLARLDDKDEGVGAAAAVALHALGAPNHLARFLGSEDAEARIAVVRVYARQRDELDQRLLSRDLDAADPWLDPKEPVTEARVASASSKLDITPEQVRVRYDAIAADVKLRLGWRTQQA